MGVGMRSHGSGSAQREVLSDSPTETLSLSRAINYFKSLLNKQAAIFLLFSILRGLEIPLMCEGFSLIGKLSGKQEQGNTFLSIVVRYKLEFLLQAGQCLIYSTGL